MTKIPNHCKAVPKTFEIAFRFCVNVMVVVMCGYLF
jgi:hypothetical protein